MPLSTLDEIILKLQELQQQGYGELPVWCNAEYTIETWNISVEEDCSGKYIELYSTGA